MGKVVLSWILLHSAFGGAADDPVARQLGGLRGKRIARASPEVAKNGEGSTIQLRDGTLLHLFSRHMRPDGKANTFANPDLWPSFICATRSADRGRTWSEAEIVFRSDTGENVMQPSLARLGNGAIGVSYSRIASLSAATKVFRWSVDEGKTWSPEVPVSPAGAYWTSAHDRMVVLSSGRILLPLHHKKSVRPEHMITQIAYSDNHGQTWSLAPQQLDVHDVIPGFRRVRPGAQGFWEATIAQLPDGSLYMLGRTYGGWLYQTRSRDEGLTWDSPKPSALMSAAAPARVERIPGTGRLLVVWNRCCLNETDGLLGARLALAAAVSDDGGETWSKPRDIESVAPGPGHRVEYPAVNIWNEQVYLTYRAQVGVGPKNLWMQEYLSIIPVSWFSAELDVHRPWLAYFQERSGGMSADQVLAAARALPAAPPHNQRLLIQQRHHAVGVARWERGSVDGGVEREEDRIFYVLEGSGVLRIGSETFREEAMRPGSVFSIPRGTAYQIRAVDSAVSLLVVAVR